ncbi:MAG TPA: nucleotide exchange factor GrpE [Candidatus Limnocylindria bacterium]|nr:nucleotide exchange factor GrpE [Candidatus Limnocylindria bacterium]
MRGGKRDVTPGKPVDLETPERDAEEPPAEAERETAETEEAPAGAERPIDFKDRWLRTEADLQTFRRRAAREAEEGRRNAEEAVFRELVAAIDDLERALDAAREAAAPESWRQGVALVVQRLRDYLQRQGVQVVDPLGQPFDPAFHEALLEVNAEAGVLPGSVVQVVHKGYARGDRALRVARVVVAREPGSASE